MADNEDRERNREREVKTTRLPLYYGTNKEDCTPRDLVERIEAYCRATRKPANAECHEMYLLLRGNAISWWNSLKISGKDIASWPVVKAEFLKDYDYRITGESAFQLVTVKQKLGESVTDYYARSALAIEDSSRGLPETGSDAELARQRTTVTHFQRNIFISGLREELRTEVLRHDTNTLDEAKEQARRAEFLSSRNQLKPATISAIYMDELEALLDQIMRLDARDEDEEEMREEEIAAINAYRHRKGRKPFKGGFRRKISAQTPFTGKCYNCDKVGHLARNCRLPRRETSNSGQVKAIQEEKPSLAPLSPLNW